MSNITKFIRQPRRIINYVLYHTAGGGNILKPKEMDEIVHLSEILSKGIPQVRVDWYVHEGQIYFGEMTFYTWAGFAEFEPWEWNYKLGSWIKLPEKYKPVVKPVWER